MLLQYIINGLSMGSVYAIIVIGYNMVYGILELLNLHTEIKITGCLLLLRW